MPKCRQCNTNFVVHVGRRCDKCLAGEIQSGIAGLRHSAILDNVDSNVSSSVNVDSSGNDSKVSNSIKDKSDIEHLGFEIKCNACGMAYKILKNNAIEHMYEANYCDRQKDIDTAVRMNGIMFVGRQGGLVSLECRCSNKLYAV